MRGTEREPERRVDGRVLLTKPELERKLGRAVSQEAYRYVFDVLCHHPRNSRAEDDLEYLAGLVDDVESGLDPEEEI